MHRLIQRLLCLLMICNNLYKVPETSSSPEKIGGTPQKCSRNFQETCWKDEITSNPTDPIWYTRRSGKASRRRSRPSPRGRRGTGARCVSTGCRRGRTTCGRPANSNPNSNSPTSQTSSKMQDQAARSRLYQNKIEREETHFSTRSQAPYDFRDFLKRE